MPKPRMYCDRCARLVRRHDLRTADKVLGVPWRHVCSRCYQELVSQHIGSGKGKLEFPEETSDLQLELPF